MKIKLNHNTSFFKDGNEWCILVGENLQEGQGYFSKDQSILGLIYEYVYEETNYYEGSAVEDLIPEVISNLLKQLTQPKEHHADT